MMLKKNPLLNIEDHTDDVDTLLANLETALQKALDSHVPEKSKVIICGPSVLSILVRVNIKKV